MVQPGYGAYRRVQAETASPAQLILLLYDGLLKRLQHALLGLEGRNYEQVNGSLQHAQDILLELVASLDMDAGEIAENLAQLYEYQHRRLIEANLRKDPEPVARGREPDRPAPRGLGVRRLAGRVAGHTAGARTGAGRRRPWLITPPPRSSSCCATSTTSRGRSARRWSAMTLPASTSCSREREALIQRVGRLAADPGELPENVVPFPRADVHAEEDDALALDTVIQGILDYDRHNEQLLFARRAELLESFPQLQAARRGARGYRPPAQPSRFIDRAS